MASRNLTEVFVLMRNNTRATRHIYADDRSDTGDSERLLNRRSGQIDVEAGGMEMRGADDCGAPPIWIDKLEETQYTISKIRPKLEELAALHGRHLLQPTLDDQCDEERQIEELSQDISKLMSSTHRHIQCIRSSLGHGKRLEQRLTYNVVAYLLGALQDVTVAFRGAQNRYLRQMRSREARSNAFFETAADFTTIDLNGDDAGGLDAIAVSFSTDLPDTEFLPGGHRHGFAGSTDEQIDAYFQRPVSSTISQHQLMLFEEDNTRMVADREREVTKVVKSIMDVNEIFKDLAGMVHEQGTILDRIDYNVEQTQVTVGEGLKQLRQAEVHQRKNRKMFCILVLASVTLVMLMLLIATKL